MAGQKQTRADVVDGDMVKQAQVAAELKDGVLFVSNEVFVE